MPSARFEAMVVEAVTPGQAILDVGSGNDPAIPLERRPPDVRYAGLDVSRRELERAPAGSYDETWVADVTRRVPELEGRFDLVLSVQVLEHVKPLDQALDNIHCYLRPGGQFLAVLSGALVYFALANRIVPQRLKQMLLRRVDPNLDLSDIFPAPYHHCYRRALVRDFRGWEHVDIIPFHAGAGYLEAVGRPVCRAYLQFEDWLERGDHANFASNYIIRGTR